MLIKIREFIKEKTSENDEEMSRISYFFAILRIIIYLFIFFTLIYLKLKH